MDGPSQQRLYLDPLSIRYGLHFRIYRFSFPLYSLAISHARCSPARKVIPASGPLGV